MSYGNSYANNPYGANPYQQGPSAEGGYGYDQVRTNVTLEISIRFRSIPMST